MRSRLPLVAASFALALLAACVGEDGILDETAATIQIVSPGNSDVIAAGESITFQIDYNDDFTPISNANLTLRSDLQGDLPGTLEDDGKSVAFFTVDDGLVAGDHLVTATVVDWSLQPSSDTVELHVVDNQPPEVEIQSPFETGLYYMGNPVDLRALVNDADHAEEDLAVLWVVQAAADPVGIEVGADPPDSNGEVVGNWTPEVADDYTLVLTVTDPLGLTASDVVQLDVLPCGDEDVDGFDCTVDCDDAEAGVNPGAVEVCNGIDDDCAGGADDGLVFTTWYADGDGDLHGDPAVATSTCDGVPPAGFVASADDCDDSQASTSPDAPELCDAVDNDCDGTADDGLVFADSYLDADADGFGDAAVTISTCDGVPVGYAAVSGDCDDAAPAVYPGAPDVCDVYTDNDCDGSPDPQEADADGDAASICAGDCDDADVGNFPGNAELCDDLDNDCSLVADDGIAFTDWFLDADLDGHGDAAAVAATCDGAPSGYVASADDCDDGDPANFPGNGELCDGQDNDCDGASDDGVTFPDWYLDADADGYGDAGVLLTTCEGAPVGYVADSTDCDDSLAAVNPGAPETCGDGVDQDCSGADCAGAECDFGTWLRYPDYVSSLDAVPGWEGTDYDDSGWSPVGVPTTPYGYTPSGYGNLYRNTCMLDPEGDLFELALLPCSDDGLWLYVNGAQVGHWGGAWGAGGCVNGAYDANLAYCGGYPSENPGWIDVSDLLVPGENTFAIAVSNWGDGGYYYYFGFQAGAP